MYVRYEKICSCLFIYLTVSLRKKNAEVRPAPHMDNLVHIYKSMEIASGANIFVSQSVPSKKLSGK